MSLWDNVKKFAQPYADDDYDDYGEDDDYLDDYEEPEKPAPARRKPRRAPAPTPAPEEEEDEEADDDGFPGSFNDTSKAADDLRNRKAVIVNMENVDKAMARRVVDFLSGCVYALDGDVKKIAQSAYLFCPHNMDIVGDLETLQAEVESYI